VSLVVGTDLDRTLIFSASAAGRSVPSVPRPDEGLVCVEHYNGTPLSYMTARAHAWAREALETGLVVPVTTRTLDQYRRIALPGPATFAVCLNGARVLHRGEVLGEWSDQVARAVSGRSDPLEVVEAEIIRASTSGGDLAPWIKSIRNASGVFCYVVCHRDGQPDGWLEALRARMGRHGWVLSVQGRKVYAVPAPLTKESALAYVAELAGAPSWAAAGDSLLDAGMVLGGDEGRVPRGSELHVSGLAEGQHVRLTDGVGLAAGEEIACWISRLTRS
jgi:hypothetical protein